MNETSLTYEKLYLGEESSKSVTVTNAGDIDQTYTVTFADANGFVIEGSSVVGPVSPGSIRERWCEVHPDEQGYRNQHPYGEDGSYLGYDGIAHGRSRRETCHLIDQG